MLEKYLKNKNINLLIIITLITCAIIHLPLYTKDILTADILLNNTYYSAYSWEISLGRFGLFIIGFLKSYLVIPHLELFICFILITLISLILIDLFKIKNKSSQVLTCIILAICPNVSATLLFNYCSLAYILAFFSSTLAIYTLIKAKNNYIKIIIPIILTIISTSMYQSYIQVSLTLLILFYIKDLLKNRFNLKEFITNIIILGIGIICYFILMKLSLIIFNINLSSYSGANTFSINNILNIPNQILVTYKTFYNYYFTNKIVNNTNLLTNIINIIFLTMLIVGIIIQIIKNKLSKKHIFILITFILILPISINSILLIIPDTKMQLLMSISYTLLIPFAFSILEKENYLKHIILILMILLVRNYIIQDTATYKSLEITYNKTNQIATNIINKINEIGYDKKIMITGNLNNNEYYNYDSNTELKNIYKLNYGFVSNSSLFWDEYVNTKNGWTRYLYQYHGVNIDFVDLKTYNQILDSKEFKDMPTYPTKKSISLIDNTIVIKIS